MSKHPASRRTSEQGFALIIVSALFIAFAVVAAAIIDRSNATQQLVLQEQTRAQLHRISSAMLQYMQFNNGLYPCPADPTKAATDPDYGHRVPNCVTSVPAGIEVLRDLNNEVIRGMVPISALTQYGLSPDDVIDSWNNKIMYVINRNLTVPGGVANMRPYMGEYRTSAVFRSPDYILISYGRDSLGGIGKNKTSASVVCPAYSSPFREINCSQSMYFWQAPVSNASRDAFSYSDDMLSFYNAVPNSCGSARLNWGTCSAVFPATASGSQRTAVNDVGSYNGTASAVCSNGVWGAAAGSCVASATPVNGVCGSAQGGTFKYPPSNNLCGAGSVSAFTESGGSTSSTGIYTWKCLGFGGGTTANCSANQSCDCNGTVFPACGPSPHDPHSGFYPPDTTRQTC